MTCEQSSALSSKSVPATEPVNTAQQRKSWHSTKGAFTSSRSASRVSSKKCHKPDRLRTARRLVAREKKQPRLQEGYQAGVEVSRRDSLDAAEVPRAGSFERRYSFSALGAFRQIG